MRTMWTIAALVAAVAFGSPTAMAQAKKIDLSTKEGVAAVKGQWKYHDVKIMEVEGKGTRRQAEQDLQHRAPGRPGVPARLRRQSVGVIAPESLKAQRSTGGVCFCWYRIKITIPPEAAGKAVFFRTTVDDYGEVWVDGKLPRTVGKGGEAIVAGFNVPNRVELKDAKPGKVYQIAVFGINGPISAAPTNWIFLKDTYLDIVDKK